MGRVLKLATALAVVSCLSMPAAQAQGMLGSILGRVLYGGYGGYGGMYGGGMYGRGYYGGSSPFYCRNCGYRGGFGYPSMGNSLRWLRHRSYGLLGRRNYGYGYGRRYGGYRRYHGHGHGHGYGYGYRNGGDRDGD